ncbi:chemokine-like receptor 1 [Chanos chanos]|uniref:Chemokine-like receptor 1 n=1 Tax=Chanos chanos TaxID=29144 RepID=A0A6J2WA34_CHACN|nr:chemokine-like receptor 1 [Chanos chanos]
MEFASLARYQGNGTDLLYHPTPTSNLTYEDYYYDDHEEHVVLGKALNIMSLIVYCLVFVLGVVGNGIVIWVTGFKMKKTVNTVWFLNLAVADFLFTASLLLSVAHMAKDCHRSLHFFMCKFNSTRSFLNMFASVYTLVVISIDRCLTVVCPIWARNYRSVQKASAVSLGVWVFALMLSSPYFLFWAAASEDVINCFNNFTLHDVKKTAEVVKLMLHHCAMIITRFLLGFVVPFSIIMSCYAVIIHRLKRNRSMSGRTGRPFKIIAAVITAFFLCWAPYHILALLEMYNYMLADLDKTLDLVITIGFPIATSLAFLNSCLNPLLYVFMSQDFKENIQESILKALEAAFTEEVSRTNTWKNSVLSSRGKEKSFSDAEV